MDGSEKKGGSYFSLALFISWLMSWLILNLLNFRFQPFTEEV